MRVLSVLGSVALLCSMGGVNAGEWVFGGSVGNASGDSGASELNAHLAARMIPVLPGISIWDTTTCRSLVSRLVVPI